MRFLAITTLPLALLLTGCAPETKPAAAPAPAKKAAKPSDETRRLPSADRVEAKVVEDHLLGYEFLPGGSTGHYKQGKVEYDLILVKTGSPTDAAILLLNTKNELENAKLIPHFGGYFGKREGKEMFAFTKNNWFCGVSGLNEAAADAKAREFAARLD
jgi:hypothetical protein